MKQQADRRLFATFGSFSSITVMRIFICVLFVHLVLLLGSRPMLCVEGLGLRGLQQEADEAINSLIDIPTDCACLLGGIHAEQLLDDARHMIGHATDNDFFSKLKEGEGETPQAELTDGFLELFQGNLGVDTFLIDGKIVNSVIVHTTRVASIFKSLAAAEQPPRISTITEGVNYWEQRQEGLVAVDRAALKQRLSQPPYDAIDEASTKTIIFVQDPFTHFIDGLTEAHYRHSVEVAGTTDPEKLPRANSETAKDVIAALAVREVDRLTPLLSHFTYFYRESISLLEWQPDFIGHMEHFETDWQRAMQLIGVDVPYIPDQEPGIAARDPLGMRAALMQMLETEPDFLRGVCLMLSIDYHCLGYPLPTQCSRLFESHLWRRYSERCE